MCGINGFINYNNNSQTLIKKMNDKIKHRGPDGEGFYVDENISLGHRRLSVIDLSENGRQPMFNEDNSMCIIFNGEIYNFQELKKELENKHKFFSQTDTEVVLHLYEEYKEKCLEKLNGIFVFAIYNTKNKELFIARDRIGVKPLYYYSDPSNSSGQARFVFSSEIKAILEHDIKREIDLGAFNLYFRLMYVPAPLTMFKGIYKLPQAHYLKASLEIGNWKLEIVRYWDIKDFKEIKSKQEIIKNIQNLMKKSIKGQLISDRPVGIFLSGGIDSTSVLGIAKEILGGPIKTFSVGFDIEDPNNKFNADLKLARETSKFYSTKHHELIIKSEDILNNLEKVVYQMDEPVAEPTQIATMLLAEEAKKHVAVILGGDGGDELFGGYKRYYYSYFLDKYRFIRFLPFLKTKVYLKFMSQKEKEVAKILNKEINSFKNTKSLFKKNYFRINGKMSFVNQYMLADLKTWLADESLMRSDKMTMAHGLEERVPILDHQLVELSVKIPSKYKMLNKNHGKAIFIEAMKKYLPKHISELDRKKVWMTPASQWLREDLNQKAKEVLSADYFSQNQQYFNFTEIQKMFDEHIDKTKYNLNLIWALIVFQMWCKKYL